MSLAEKYMYDCDAHTDALEGIRGGDRQWLSQITLNNFRNYSHAKLSLDQRPVVITGYNGAGKTNLMEAVSLLVPGTGLRKAAYADIGKMSSSDSWVVSVKIHTSHGDYTLGTGLNPSSIQNERASRLVRVDGETISLNDLQEYVYVSWLTPAMDGLFTGSSSDRRRFFDRLITCFDAGYQKRLNMFERAMRQRNKLFETESCSSVLFDGLELQMAEIGVSIAATRFEVLNRLSGAIMQRKDSQTSSFPWANIALEGKLEDWLSNYAAIEVEDMYSKTLRESRNNDRAAKRTLIGPHRTDFLVEHGPKSMPARYCSTGEQKALLVGIILAHIDLVKQLNDGFSPIVLLDEIAAHFDETKRAELFEEILQLGVQAWMTGTDRSMFSSFGDNAQYFTIENGNISS